jgi:hypothetical protein
MEEVTNQIAILLEECHERGMPLPYLLVAVAINGSIMACRYVESESGEELNAEVSRPSMTRWYCLSTSCLLTPTVRRYAS